jgi:subtilisin family serine protease
MCSRLRRTALQPLAAVAVAAFLLGPSLAWATASAGTTRLLVKFRPGASGSAALTAAGARSDGTIHDIGVRVVSVPTNSASTALLKLRGNPNVQYAERDRILKPQDDLPSDPSFPQQFPVGGGAWGWYKTHTTQAWDITRGDPSVVIAVIDTGLKTSGLDDFSGQVVPGWNVLNNTSDTSSDAGSHGTYVAGVAGLAIDNGMGNAGFCPGCKIMPVQVGTDTGAADSDIASGITWAADHGARVENLSWAGPGSSSAIANAVAYARSKGVVVVAAAGNSNCNCTQYPAATPGVLGVAGTDTTDNKQGDSNYGSWVKLAAPEGNMTAWPSINGAPGYSPVGGTSLAAPVVAGIAGLLFSANPALSGSQVEQALEQSAVPVNFSVAYGRVDALAALQSLGFSDPQPSSVPVSGKAPQIMLETNGDWNYTPLSSAPQAGQVLLRGQGSWTGSAPLSLSAVKWLRCDSSGSNCTTAATTTRYTVQSTDAGYTFKLLVTVKNGLGSTTSYSALSLPVGGSAPPPPPAPPANTSPPTISGTPQAGQTLSASTGSWTGSPTSYAYQWERCDSGGTSCSDVAGATAASYALTSADVGATMRVTVGAANSAGATAATSAATALVAAAPPPPPPPPPPPSTQTATFSGSLTAKNPLRVFSVTVGAGLADARLSFSKCSSLSLAVGSSAASALATKTGPSVNVLDATLPAGTYNYAVSGGRCSFTLTVTAPSP